MKYCEKSILNILLYRNNRKLIEKKISMGKYSFPNNYHPRHLNWIRYQHQQIEIMGLHNWFAKSDGPLGFESYNNIKKK